MSQFDQPAPPAGAALPPNRGGTILALGIISIVTAGCAGIPGIICSLVALSMAGKDRREIAAGTMSRDGEGLIQAGKICSIVGLCFSILNFLFWGAYLIVAIIAVIAGAAGSP